VLPRITAECKQALEVLAVPAGNPDPKRLTGTTVAEP
jgi:hypothetical protein